MIKLIDVHGGGGRSAPSSPRVSSPTGRRQAEVMRLQKDLSELDLPPTVCLSFPHGTEDLTEFEVSLTPDEGYYAGGTFTFLFRVPESYPSDPPRVKCLTQASLGGSLNTSCQGPGACCRTQVFHPAIDREGNVDMSLLGDEWRADMSVKTVLYGLHSLFLLPDNDDALNSAAGDMLHTSRDTFEQAVHESVRTGATIEGKFYPAAKGGRTVCSRD
ncbi:NEDD8-conjugating enzyme Ubc12 [Chlorella vulgaris]